MGKAQKTERKMAILASYLRNEHNITKHQLVQYGQTDTSVEAVRRKLDELTRKYEQSKATDNSARNTASIPEGI